MSHRTAAEKTRDDLRLEETIAKIGASLIHSGRTSRAAFLRHLDAELALFPAAHSNGHPQQIRIRMPLFPGSKSS